MTRGKFTSDLWNVSNCHLFQLLGKHCPKRHLARSTQVVLDKMVTDILVFGAMLWLYAEMRWTRNFGQVGK